MSHSVEIRCVCMHSHCDCGGKIHRVIIRGLMSYGGNGNEVMVVYVQDRCVGTCRQVIQESGKSHQPIIEDLQSIFDKWELGQTSYQDFDSAINAAFRQVDLHLQSKHHSA